MAAIVSIVGAQGDAHLSATHVQLGMYANAVYWHAAVSFCCEPTEPVYCSPFIRIDCFIVISVQLQGVCMQYLHLFHAHPTF